MFLSVKFVNRYFTACMSGMFPLTYAVYSILLICSWKRGRYSDRMRAFSKIFK